MGNRVISSHGKNMYIFTYIPTKLLDVKRMSYTVYKLTPQKVNELKSELKNLTTVERRKIADELDWFRDLSNKVEDSAYFATLEEKSYLEKRIMELKEILHNYEVLNPVSANGSVDVGSKVKVAFGDYKDEFTIVSALEADPMNKKISDRSPVGKALIGARKGDKIDVNTGTIQQQYKVLAIN